MAGTGELPTTEAAVCVICGLPGPRHVPLAHRIAQAARPGPVCGCDPSDHDGTGPCILRPGHVGVCVGLSLDEQRQPTGPPVQVACRDDDSTPHPEVSA
jgi:hypothetical protein